MGIFPALIKKMKLIVYPLTDGKLSKDVRPFAVSRSSTQAQIRALLLEKGHPRKGNFYVADQGDPIPEKYL
jgi:hypothetical protein